MSMIVEKELSGNDTGETGGHQAGMLIPKDDAILRLFPLLGRETKNPRCVIDFVDETEKTWSFNFIYYNNRFFGGTRNEYRLTGMTGFIRAFNLKTGDFLIFEKASPRLWRISYRRKNATEPGGALKLIQSAWRIIDISADE